MMDLEDWLVILAIGLWILAALAFVAFWIGVVVIIWKLVLLL